MSRPSSPDDSKGSKCSLPSISSLIEAANSAPEHHVDRSPRDSRSQRIGAQTPTYGTERPMPQYPSSPSATSSSYSSYPINPSSNGHLEGYAPRQMNYPPVPQNGSWLSSQDQHHPQYPSPNASPSMSSAQHHAPPSEMAPYPALSQQRSLPSNFPPPYPVDPSQHSISQATPTWQHHHYFPPSASNPYPQTQERYVCPTCNKPFSRPSSLKIHTYSHTGEKPYKCKHEGCGKYFSVRSNMKRHEKGCHGDTGSPGGISPGGM